MRNHISIGSLTLCLSLWTGFVSTARGEVDEAVLQAEADRVAVLEKVTACTLAIFGDGGAGGGSGVIISPDGYALTNFHVAQPMGNAMKCGMSDGNLYDAVIVGLDPTGDVALIKLFGRDDFPTAELGDSSAVQAGDWAYAIGNPFLLATNFQPTVSYGVISGVQRYQYPAGTLLEYTDCLQTDAAINPGNSGGPLFDDSGRLIGINGRGSFEKRGRVNVGVGYAISINQIKNFMGYLHSGRIVDHASWGTRVSSDDEGRVVVTTIQDDSDAFRRGIRYDDEIMRFGGREIRTVNGLKNVLGIFPKGWRIPVTYRQEGDTFHTVVRLIGTHGQGELIQRISGRKPIELPDQPPEKKKPEGKDSEDKAPDGEEKPPRRGHKGPMRPKAKKAEMPKIVKEHFEARTGYANYYFNELHQNRVWKAFQGNGAFGELPERWILRGQTSPPGDVHLVLTTNYGNLQLPQFGVEADFGDELNDIVDPPGSGGLLLSLHLWQRFLREGIENFGDVYYLGTVPSKPTANEAELRDRMYDVLVGTHGGVECRFHFDPVDGKLRTMEVFSDDDVDPCELDFQEYRQDGGRDVPAKVVVRHGDEIYTEMTFESIEFKNKEE